ncbi:MAG: hypothetical protein ACE37F_11830 [Nannocystaceae bacterium]|nr:hypothetical protein [bacterium]
MALLALAAACEPYEDLTEVAELPDEYLLTSDAPLIALEVVACIRGEAPPEFEIEGYLRTGSRTDEGEVAVNLENLASGERATIDTVSDIYNYASVPFVLDAAWAGSGRRCSAPEVIEISADLAPGQEVTLFNPDGRVFASWSNSRVCNDPLDAGEVSLEIQRL